MSVRTFSFVFSLGWLLSTGAVSAGAAELTAEQMAAAVRVESVTIPTAGELLAALEKIGRANWQMKYRPPIPTAFTSRPQIALNLGGLIADGYLAVQAEDTQQVKNIGKDIVALAKTLGVSSNVLSRGGSITKFAENDEWSALKEELEATQNEVKLAMEEQHDQELVILVSLGAWVRGTEAISSLISEKENYSPAAARLLRQPAIVAYLRNRLNDLPKRVQNEGLMRTVHKKLSELETLVSFAPDSVPDAEGVKRIEELAAEMVREISKKKG